MVEFIQQFGPYGGALMILLSVIVFLFKKLEDKQKELDAERAARLTDAITARDKVVVPLEQVTKVTEKTYEFIVENMNSNSRRRK